MRRPVDIDRSLTGFTSLRSLRIYRFDPGSVIDGHAEEDEVLIVVIAGSVELTLMDDSSGENPQPFTLSGAADARGQLRAAYLPPHGAYRLAPLTTADVAYARATPSDGRPATVFYSVGQQDRAGISLLWEEVNYPRMLRVRLLQIRTEKDEIALTPVREEEASCEGLIHVRSMPEEGSITVTRGGERPASLVSWDTVSIAPGDCPVLRLAAGASALVLVIVSS